MSVVQDLVVPDLKAALTRVEGLERCVDRLGQQMNHFEDRMEKRFDEVMSGIQTIR